MVAVVGSAGAGSPSADMMVCLWLELFISLCASVRYHSTFVNEKATCEPFSALASFRSNMLDCSSARLYPAFRLRRLPSFFSFLPTLSLYSCICFTASASSCASFSSFFAFVLLSAPLFSAS